MIFSLILVSYYLTNSLKINQISFKKWIKIVYFASISHNFVLIPAKPVAFTRRGRIFNQWLYVTCGRSVSETEFQWRNICKKCTSSRKFREIPNNFRYSLIYLDLLLLLWYNIIIMGENNNIPHWTLTQSLCTTIELRCNLNKRPAARRIVKIFIDRAKKTCYNGRRYSELHCSLTKPNKNRPLLLEDGSGLSPEKERRKSRVTQ